MNALAIYAGSDGVATRRLYEALEQKGIMGSLATNLFRAQKCSVRAKLYRGKNSNGSFRSQAYDRKNWSLQNLCRSLSAHAGTGIRWGWKIDLAAEFHNWVLYVDLPTGQVSFHSAAPLSPERYEGDWDQTHLSAERIIRFTQSILDLSPEYDKLTGADFAKYSKPISTAIAPL